MKNLKIKYLPEKFVVSNKWIEYYAEYRYNSDKHNISYKESFKYKTNKVEPVEYSAFRNDMREIVKFSKNRIFLKGTEIK